MARGKKSNGRSKTPRTDNLEKVQREMGSATEGELTSGVEREPQAANSSKGWLTTKAITVAATLTVSAATLSNLDTILNKVEWLLGWDAAARKVLVVEELEHRLAAACLHENDNARLNALDARSVAPLHTDFSDYRSKALLKELEKLTTGGNRDALQKFLQDWPPSHVEQTHLDALWNILKAI